MCSVCLQTNHLQHMHAADVTQHACTHARTHARHTQHTRTHVYAHTRVRALLPPLPFSKLHSRPPSTHFLTCLSHTFKPLPTSSLSLCLSLAPLTCLSHTFKTLPTFSLSLTLSLAPLAGLPPAAPLAAAHPGRETDHEQRPTDRQARGHRRVVGTFNTQGSRQG